MTYDKDPVKIDITKEDVPPALLMKVRFYINISFSNTSLIT